MKVWIPPWPSMTPPCCVCLIIYLWGWASRLPIQLLLAWEGVGSWFFVWCFTRVALLLLKIFCLARLSLPGLLAKERTLSLGLFFFFFFLYLLVFPGCQLFSCKWSKKKTQGTHWVVPQDLRFLGSLPPFPTFHRLLMFVLSVWLSVTLSGKKRVKYSYSIFLEVDGPVIPFEKLPVALHCL